MKIPLKFFPVIYYVTLGFAFIFCFMIAFENQGHWKSITKNKFFYEWFPSVTSTVGDFIPENLVFRTLAATCTTHKIVMIISYFFILHGLINSKTGVKLALSEPRKILKFKVVSWVFIFVSFFKLLSATLWIFVSRLENWETHYSGFIGYLLFSLIERNLIIYIVYLRSSNLGTDDNGIEDEIKPSEDEENSTIPKKKKSSLNGEEKIEIEEKNANNSKSSDDIENGEINEDDLDFEDDYDEDYADDNNDENKKMIINRDGKERKLKHVKIASLKESYSFSLKFKSVCLSIMIILGGIAAYFYLLYQSKVFGAFSKYALLEWVILIFELLFDLTAYWDFKGLNITLDALPIR